MLKRFSSKVTFQSSFFSTAPARPTLGTAIYESNTPREDRDFAKVLCDSVTTVVGVIDGHCGYRVADLLKRKVLNKIEDKFERNSDEAAIKSIMTSSYLDSDNELLQFALGNKGAYADQGACVLTAVITADFITVANAGDSGCLLVASNGSTEWLNVFHNAASPTEQDRLSLAHPGESDAFECIPVGRLMRTPYGLSDVVCYTKGMLQPTRALGDLYLKDMRFKPEKLTSFSPPYLTAEPELMTVQRLATHKYLVLATDGLWEQLTPLDVSDILLKNETGKNASELAGLIVDAAVHKAAKDSEIPVNILLNKSPKQSARNIIDDVTVSVVSLSL